jgi:hypothetical protein
VASFFGFAYMTVVVACGTRRSPLEKCFSILGNLITPEGKRDYRRSSPQPSQITVCGTFVP